MGEHAPDPSVLCARNANATPTCAINLISDHSKFRGYGSVMNNASIYYVSEVVEMIQGVGAMVIFLPPYSPDYNPIEEAFCKVEH